MSAETDAFYDTITARLGNELDAYFAQVLSTDPRFARAYYRRRAAEPPPLCMNGHEYPQAKSAATETRMARSDWWRFATAILILAAVVLIAHSPAGAWKFP